MIKIYDNFIPLNYQKELLKMFSDVSFAWHYQDSIVSPDSLKEYPNNAEKFYSMYFFGHVLKKDQQESKYFTEIEPLIYFFEDKTGHKVKNIVRVVANLTPPEKENKLGLPHVDAHGDNVKLKTMLYYINDSDGDTCIFSEKFPLPTDPKLTMQETITPKMGRAIVFDADQFHCNSTSTGNRRMVINFILEVE